MFHSIYTHHYICIFKPLHITIYYAIIIRHSHIAADTLLHYCCFHINYYIAIDITYIYYTLTFIHYHISH